MQLGTEKQISQQFFVFPNQCFVIGIGKEGNPAGDPVCIEGEFAIPKQIVESAALGCNVIEQQRCGDGENILNLKAGVLVDQTVFLKSYETFLVVNMKNFICCPPITYDVRISFKKPSCRF